MNKEIHEHIAQYLAKKQVGNENLPMPEKIKIWLKESDLHRVEFEKLEKTWQLSQQKAFPKPDINNAWEKVQERISTKPLGKEIQMPQQNIWSWGKYAAAITLLISATAFWLFTQSSMWFKLNNQQFATTNGERKNITLADGTKVLLNENSILYYPKEFTSNERKILLEGEGYFDVAHKPTQPFVVEAGSTKTMVLGTVFNLRYYPSEGFTEVFLKEGKVAFESDKEKEILQPGEVVSYMRGEGLAKKEATANDNILAWHTGVLKFNEASINDVMGTLSRFYNIDVTINESTGTNCNYTGTFNDLSLEEVFELMQFSSDFTYKKENKEYIITGSLCP